MRVIFTDFHKATARFKTHAPTVIDDQPDGDRNITVREMFNLLGLLVLEHAEIFLG